MINEYVGEGLRHLGSSIIVNIIFELFFKQFKKKSQ